jgi:hypothetical protein
MRNKIKKILRESILKRDYKDRMIYGLSLNGETKDEWSLYDSLVSELRKMGDDRHIDEIQYRLSDNEVPINVITEVLNKIKYKNKELRIIEKNILLKLKNNLTKKIELDHLQ